MTTTVLKAEHLLAMLQQGRAFDVQGRDSQTFRVIPRDTRAPLVIQRSEYDRLDALVQAAKGGGR